MKSLLNLGKQVVRATDAVVSTVTKPIEKTAEAIADAIEDDEDR